MTYEPLHHKYRPQTFAELVGQEAIASTLTSALHQQKIAPAYLFTGARGTGKTSSARILAKSLNCLRSGAPTETPCGTCEVCRAIASGSALDVIEIDAASNTGVDNIRELIERAQFAPVQCRYKVYVIDECHMLSTAAFNALLKTLEEPPDRVVFVLATTDPQRVLPTIISRCQRFDFRRIGLEAMSQHLRAIADKEGIAISNDAITLVAQIAQGGLRDAESLLDQLSLLPGEVGVEQVWDLVGSVPERDLMSLMQAISQNDPEAVLDHVRRLMDRGREPLIVLQNLAGFYRDLLIAKTAPNRNDLVALTPATWTQLCQFAQNLDTAVILAGQQQLRSSEGQLKNTTQPRLWLEVTLMGLLPSAISPQLTATNPQFSNVNHRAAANPAIPTIPTRTEHPAHESAAAQSAPPREGAVFFQPEAAKEQPEPASPAPATEPTEPTPQPPYSKQVPVATGQDAKPGVPDLQPTINPANAASNTTSQPAAQPAIGLGEVWQEVLKYIQPPSTQMLLRQQSCLVELSDREAQIGITAQWYKTAKERIATLEAAFETYLKRRVQVSVVALSAADLKLARESGSPGAPPDHPATPANSNPAPTPTTVLPTPTQRHPPAEEIKTSNPTPTPAYPPNPAPSTFATSEDTRNPQAQFTNREQQSWEQDEGTTAARLLADFFAGKVIDDTDGIEVKIDSPLDSDNLNSAREGSIAAIWNEPESDSESDSDVPF
jgi:DNA polymerase-3 subunit gamma/tau